MVNRLWARLLGRGLVEPVDEMDNPPWNADVLDWLAEDFVEHGYDVKHLLKWIITSRAYQMPSGGEESANSSAFVFRGPTVRRLSAEQFVDAVSALTGAWQSNPAAPLSIVRKRLDASDTEADDSQSLRYRSGLVNEGATRLTSMSRRKHIVACRR